MIIDITCFLKFRVIALEEPLVLARSPGMLLITVLATRVLQITYE